MAAISTVSSDIVYNVQLIVFGAWAACGVISGIGRIVGTSWAVRLQIILCWIAFAAFAVPGVVIIFYIARGPAGNFVALFAVAAGVLLTGIPFLIYARRRQRELRDGVATKRTE